MLEFFIRYTSGRQQAEKLVLVQLDEVFRKYSGDEALSHTYYHRQYFSLISDEAIVFNNDQRIVIVGQKVTPEIKRHGLKGQGENLTEVSMKDWISIQQRILRDTIPVRLGGLAANLRRIKSFTAQETSRDIVASLFEESKFFIEWTAREILIDTAAQLVELQVKLARRQYNWPQIWSNPSRRQQVADQALAWLERVLGLSGLIES
jgi:hypothetical protein